MPGEIFCGEKLSPLIRQNGPFFAGERLIFHFFHEKFTIMGKYGRVLPKCWGIFTVKWQEKGAPEGAPERVGHALFFAGKDGHAKGSDSHESGRGGDHIIGAGGGVLLVIGLGGLLGGGDDDGDGAVGGRGGGSRRKFLLFTLGPNCCTIDRNGTQQFISLVEAAAIKSRSCFAVYRNILRSIVSCETEVPSATFLSMFIITQTNSGFRSSRRTSPNKLTIINFYL